ncbi:MAG TPA: 1-acyl-sn-glycerol-3-phosphate acyltransferase [Luteolibacter sp.]|nr:1-acyl-sn-glycerol-3-phosphate acyltransferase [Luteolibacter sp.]
MRRLRNDLPYKFRPPRMKGWFRPFALLANRRFLLERTYRISRLETSGFEKVGEMAAAGNAVVLAPNHSDHSDPHLILECGARHGFAPFFMGAREIFEVSPVVSWALQSMGVFSVDRDGPDISAIKMALGILEKGGSPLVIYPEGEIYHHHARLDPLHDGVASIILKSAGNLPEGKEAHLFPVAVRFFHDPTVEGTFRDRLSKLEDRIGWTPKPSMSVDERIVRLGSGILALKETEYLGRANGGELQNRLTELCETLLGIVEARHGRDARVTTPPERVRALRYRIRKRLLDGASPPSEIDRQLLLDDLDRVFTALQAHSYIGDYLLADPTLDRRAETILKLEEDLLGFPTYPAPRIARVTAGSPIPVKQMLVDGRLPAKGGAGELTAILEKELSSMLADGVRIVA